MDLIQHLQTGYSTRMDWDLYIAWVNTQFYNDPSIINHLVTFFELMNKNLPIDNN